MVRHGQHSEETKQRIAENHKGRTSNICVAVFGKRRSELNPDEERRFKQLAKTTTYYRRHGDNVVNMREYKQQRKRDVINALELEPSCQRCGYDKYIGALDFHHKNPEDKTANVLTLPLSHAIEEAKKCMLICANCHRETHAEDNAPKATGRPRKVDPLLEVYMRASGCTEEQVQNALSGRRAA
jgi:5-methylcytosine-specific restriction endonuclease McrA